MADGLLRTTVSIRQERMPPPGVRERAWAWDDVLGASPPSLAREREAGQMVVRHGFDEDPDPESRVGFATLVEVADASLHVDERVVVEPRVLSGVMRAERMVSRQLTRGGAAGARIVEVTTEAVSSRVPGRGGAVVRRSGGLLARAVDWVATAIADGLRATVEAPDRLFSGADAAGAHLRARSERGAFLRGFLDPHKLTREGKAAALVLALGALLALAIAGTLAVVLVAPASAGAWRAALSYFALGLGSTLFFPFFPELTFASVAAQTGPVVAIAAIALGMTTGGWLVLFLGEGVNGALRASVAPDSPVARFLDAAEAVSRRYGFWVAAVVLAIPYGPDTPVFYVLASVRTPTGLYVAGTLVGTVARFALLHYLFLSGVVPEVWGRLIEWLPG